MCFNISVNSSKKKIEDTFNAQFDLGYEFIPNDSFNGFTNPKIPVITNENVYFTVGNETKIFKEGEFWEINNSGKVHSVSNKSDKGRINLIADWIT